MKKSVYFLLFTKSRNSHRTVNKVTRSCRFWFVKQTFLPHNHFIKQYAHQLDPDFRLIIDSSVRHKKWVGQLKAEQNFPQWRIRSAW